MRNEGHALRRLVYGGVLLSVVCAGTISRELLAQARDEVSLSIGIADADELPAPPARASRMYAEPRQFRLPVGIANRSASKGAVFVDLDGIRRTFGLLIQREMEIPITIQWLDEVMLNAEPMTLPLESSWVRLEPGQYLGRTVVVERVDGRPFDSGQYYLTGGFQKVRNALRNVDGTAYQGQVSEPLGQWSLLVRLPTSTAERVRMHESAGSAALARRDLARALAEYTQLLQIEPANVGAQLAMGSISLQAGRYREAIEWWERVAPRLPSGSNHAVNLAMAYVGAGQDYKATEVLRAAGL